MYKEVSGDLVEMAKNFEFDVVAHGTNCFNRQLRGLAPQMAAAFKTDQFQLEREIFKGDVDKLGRIDYTHLHDKGRELTIVNCYIQFYWSTPERPNPIDYHALTLCLQKLNHKFKGKHIGLPIIGGGLAGGDPETIKKIIQNTMTDVNVTVVKYNK